MTPEKLLAYSTEANDVAKGVQLFDAYEAAVRKHEINLATQLLLVAYLLAEMERSAPRRGIIMPALAQLVAENVSKLDLHDAPTGQPC